MKNFIYLFFSSLILSSIIIFNIHYNLNINEIEKRNYNNNILPNKFINYKYNIKRYLSDSTVNVINQTFQNNKIKKNFFIKLKKRFREHLFDGKVNYTNYTKNNMDNKTKTGLMTMRVILPFERKFLFTEEYPSFIIRVMENNTIENTIFISIINNIPDYFDFYKNIKKIDSNIKLHSYNETYINISYNSEIEKVHYFNTPYSRKLCNILYNINFIEDLVNNKNNNKTDIKEIIGIKGNLFSKDCGIKMEFNLKKHSNIKFELYGTILIYSIISSIISIFHSINTKLLIKKISNSLVNRNSICIFTICQDIVWNCYCCYCHFYFLLKFIEFRFSFMLVCSLYFFNSGYVEFPLLYQLLCLKYSYLINDALSYRKEIIKFCFILYISVLFSFLFVSKFYYSPTFILFSFIIIWLPQIIFNIYSKNRVSFPIIFIFGIILNRIFPSFYFNCVKDNFLRIPNNIKMEIINIFILLILTLILYSQTLYGPRWFLPMLQVEEYNFYIDEKELRQLKDDVDNLECLICLNPIILNENINNNEINNDNEINNNEMTNNSYNDNISNFNETDNLVINVNNKSSNKVDKNTKKNKSYLKLFKFKCKSKCIVDKSIIFNFHEFSKNIYNKPFMITPCKHVFHSECLEEWFKMKKECPNCRTIITQDMYN